MHEMFYFFGKKTPTSVVTSIAHNEKMSALPLAAPRGKMIWKGDVYFNLYELHNAMQCQHDVIITFPQKMHYVK